MLLKQQRECSRHSDSDGRRCGARFSEITPALSWLAISPSRSRRRSVCSMSFVVLDVGTRRIRHWNVTEHPTAEWTAQQFRMVMSGDEAHRWLIHDRDSIYSVEVDRTITGMG